jgi:hypothetical protein
LALLPAFAFFVGPIAGTMAGAVAGAGPAGADAVATGFSVAFDSTAFDVDAVVPALPDSPFAAALSVLTAFSRALVAAVIAASALVSAFADVPARVAAMFSLAVADVTLVAAAETVRGVTVAGPLLAPLLAIVLPTLVLLAVARALVALVVAVAPVLLVARALDAGLAVVLVAGFLALSVVPVLPVVPGSVAAVFVGTDLHPHLGQLRGWHSTESDALHLIARKNSKVIGTKHYRELLFGLRQQPAHDPQRLLRRRATADRDPHQVAGQRHRIPDHAMRDVPGQVKHPGLHILGKHHLGRNIKRRPHLTKPRVNVSHAPHFLPFSEMSERRQRTSVMPSPAWPSSVASRPRSPQVARPRSRRCTSRRSSA